MCKTKSYFILLSTTTIIYTIIVCIISPILCQIFSHVPGFICIELIAVEVGILINIKLSLIDCKLKKGRTVSVFLTISVPALSIVGWSKEQCWGQIEGVQCTHSGVPPNLHSS